MVCDFADSVGERTFSLTFSNRAKTQYDNKFRTFLVSKTQPWKRFPCSLFHCIFQKCVQMNDNDKYQLCVKKTNDTFRWSNDNTDDENTFLLAVASLWMALYNSNTSRKEPNEMSLSSFLFLVNLSLQAAQVYINWIMKQ